MEQYKEQQLHEYKPGQLHRFKSILKSVNCRQLSRQKDVRVKASEQKYLHLYLLFFTFSGVRNQGKALSFVCIGLEASFEEPVTASFT